VASLPRSEEYFADPAAHQEYARSQFDGERLAPWQSWDLHRLAFHPDLMPFGSARVWRRIEQRQLGRIGSLKDA
jgi:hypothetical protein